MGVRACTWISIQTLSLLLRLDSNIRINLFSLIKLIVKADSGDPEPSLSLAAISLNWCLNNSRQHKLTDTFSLYNRSIKQIDMLPTFM